MEDLLKSKPLTGNFGTGSVRVRVPFHDIDLIGVAWHGHFVKYFELARHALFAQMYYDVEEMRNSGFYYPVVKLDTKFLKPAKYNDELEVQAVLKEYLNRIVVKYVIYRFPEKEVICRGSTIQVAVDAATEELSYVTPASLVEKIEKYYGAKN